MSHLCDVIQTVNQVNQFTHQFDKDAFIRYLVQRPPYAWKTPDFCMNHKYCEALNHGFQPYTVVRLNLSIRGLDVQRSLN